jgi:hypothetical protein
MFAPPRKKPLLRTEDAVRLLGLDSFSALARALGITRSAVAQWGGVVPELQQYRIEDLARQREAAAADSAPVLDQVDR